MASKREGKHELVKAGKIPQANYYIEAELKRRRIRRELVSGVNSITALYMANPGKKEALIPSSPSANRVSSFLARQAGRKKEAGSGQPQSKEAFRHR